MSGALSVQTLQRLVRPGGSRGNIKLYLGATTPCAQDFSILNAIIPPTSISFADIFGKNIIQRLHCVQHNISVLPRLSGTQTISPVTGASRLVSYGDNDNFFRRFFNDYIERETFESKFFCSLPA